MYSQYSYNNNYIDDDDKPSERQMSAENYLKEYKIEEILTEMINYLLHKKSKSPIVAMIKYLGGLLSEKEREEYKLVIPDPQIDYHPIVDFPTYDSKCQSLLKECLTMEIFSNSIQKISKYGINIGSILRVNKVFPKNNIGCMIGDADCLNKYDDIYKPIICKAHNLNINSLKDFTQNYFNLNNLVFDDIKKIDIGKIKGLKKISFSISRNLYDSPFVCFLNVENRTEKIAQQLLDLNKIPILKSINRVENMNKIKLNKLLRKINYDMDFWNAVNPNDNLIQKQRIIYINEDDTFLLLINFCDNFQMIKTFDINDEINTNKESKENNDNKDNKDNKDNNNENKYINKFNKFNNNDNKNNTNEFSSNKKFIKYFNQFNDLIRNIQYYFGFEFNHNYGYLTSNIALLGRGFSITSEIDLEQLYGDEPDINMINKKLEKFDKYTDTYFFKKNEEDGNNNDNDENILVFTSSPKISKESFPEFLVEYFEKIEGLQK